MAKKVKPAKRLQDYYAQQFKERHGVAPAASNFGAASGQIINRLVAGFDSDGKDGEAVVEKMIHDYVWCNEWFARQAGWPLRLISTMANQLMLRGGAEAPDARMAGNIEAARRAVAPRQDER